MSGRDIVCCHLIKWSQLQFLGKDFVGLRFRLRPPFFSSTLSLVATSISLLRLQFPFSCRDLKCTSRPQMGSFIQKLVATSFSCRHLICGFINGSTSRPQIGVATSASALNNFLHLHHIFLVATSLTGLGDVVT